MMPVGNGQRDHLFVLFVEMRRIVPAMDGPQARHDVQAGDVRLFDQRSSGEFGGPGAGSGAQNDEKSLFFIQLDLAGRPGAGQFTVAGSAAEVRLGA